MTQPAEWWQEHLTVATAHRMSLGSAQIDQPGWLPTGWATAELTARTLALAAVREGPGGSVDLVNRSLPAGFVPGGATARKPPMPDEEAPGPGFGRRLPLWRRLAHLLQTPADLLLTMDGPIEWPAPLYPYQVEGVATLMERESLLLADDLGLGKTIQAIAALRLLLLRRQAEMGLVVAPAGLVTQWRQALRTWAPELRLSTVRGPLSERDWQWRTPAHVYLTSYETLREDMARRVDMPRAYPWDVAILDEAHRIKNRESAISQACKRLRRRRSWALSGTPLENSLDDLASILEFVTLRPAPGSTEPPNAQSLPERLATVQLRRRKADVLPQLPPKTVSPIVLSLTGAQRESYERAERDGVLWLRERGEQVRLGHVLEVITRLKQVCNVCPTTGHSAKLDDLAGRIATLQAEGHRALVFTQFTDATFGARAIARHLAAFHPLTYTGDLLHTQREAVIEEFKTRPDRPVLVLSLRAGGLGLNLQEATYVFHFDRWWNPSVERQAEDRSHRLGQTVPVHVYTYTCEGTIEERIERILRRKRQLFQDVVDDVTLSTALTNTELFGLFGLTPSAESSIN